MLDTSSSIKRKIYQFDMRKKYQYASSYKLKDIPPIEKIKAMLKEARAPKKEEKKVILDQAQPKGGFNFVVFGAFLLIALIVISVGWLYLTTQVLTPGVALSQTEMEKPTIENKVLDTVILVTGQKNSPQHIAAINIDYALNNIDNYTINITTFPQKIPSEVFILNSERVEATSYPEFLRSLRSELDKTGIVLNEITISQLETMPQGAVVVVPSGVIPKEMLGIDSQITMDKLADRGVVVIYMGQKFTKVMDGTLISDTPTSILNSLPIGFDEATVISKTSDTKIYQPLYLVNGRGKWYSGTLYGAISVVKKGDGAFIFFPQTLDGGWRGDGETAALEISNMITTTAWAEQSSETKTYFYYTNISEKGNQYFFSSSFPEENTTLKIEFIGYSQKSINPIKQTIYTRINSHTTNQLFIESGGSVVSTNVSETPVRMNAYLHESVPSEPSMSILIQDLEGETIQELPQGPVNVQADRSFDVRVYVDKGEYIIKLVDDTGKEYTNTYMKVVAPEFEYTGGVKDKPAIYVFYVSMDDIPLKLAEVTVKVDGGRFGEYTFSDSEYLYVDVGAYTGNERLPVGENHTFEFTTGKLTTPVNIKHERMQTPLENPLVLLVLIFTGGIVGVGMVFARQEESNYSIDIPDFPPVAKTKISVKSEAILGIFDKINETYHWQYTPLTPGEIKNGFKQILHDGKPIYITDYNVEFLLHELEKKEFVKESNGYYGRVEWEGQSKHSIEYLAMMRRIRDICVNNAIPFLPMDEARNSDTVLTVMGQQMFLHFYERGTDMEKLLNNLLMTLRSGITIVVFKNSFDKNHFQEVMNSTASTVPLLVKMEASSSAIVYQTTEELEKMVLEFKSM